MKLEQLADAYPGLKTDPESFTSTLVNAVELTGNKMAAILFYSDEQALRSVIKLKWNKTAKGAIDQIKAKRYPEAIRGCGGRAMLTEITGVTAFSILDLNLRK